MVEEEERVAVGFIAGKIRLELTPPNGIDILPEVFVDEVKITVKREGVEVNPTWKYMTVAEKGDHKVRFVLGNTVRERDITVKPGGTIRLNFVLGDKA